MRKKLCYAELISLEKISNYSSINGTIEIKMLKTRERKGDDNMSGFMRDT